MATYFTEEEVAGLSPDLVRLLDQIRGMVGFPLVITSGKRPPGIGVKDSAHISGLAADLRSRSWESHFKIVEAAIDSGIARVGVYHDRDMRPTHVHVDIDESKPFPRLWIDISQ